MMDRAGGRRRQLNNRGFTLVELIVGAIILAVIVSPLLHTFLSSARAAQKARDMNDVTMAAQNVVETITALGVANVVGDGGRSLKDSVKAGNASFYTYSVAGNSYSVVAAEDLPLPLGMDQYYIGLKGIELSGGSSDAPSFDAMVTLDAAEYKDPATNKLNEQEIVNFPGVKHYYLQSDGEDLNNPDYVAVKSCNYLYEFWGGTPNSVGYDDLVRTIIININKESSSDAISATIEYTYAMIERGPIEDPDGETEPIFDGKLYPSPATKEIDPFTPATGETATIYLFYQPNCNPHTEEKFNVLNNSEQPVNLFLIKQGDYSYSVNPVLIGPNNTASGSNTTVYSNVESLVHRPSVIDIGEKTAIVLTEPQNRIYKVHVDLYQAGTLPVIDTDTEVLFSFTATCM